MTHGNLFGGSGFSFTSYTFLMYLRRHNNVGELELITHIDLCLYSFSSWNASKAHDCSSQHVYLLPKLPLLAFSPWLDQGFTILLPCAKIIKQKLDQLPLFLAHFSGVFLHSSIVSHPCLSALLHLPAAAWQRGRLCVPLLLLSLTRSSLCRQSSLGLLLEKLLLQHRLLPGNKSKNKNPTLKQDRGTVK